MAEQGRRNHRYRFLDKEDEARLLRNWGGEEMIRRQYPAVWKAIVRTKEYENDMLRVRSVANQGVRGSVDVGCPNMVEVTADAEDAQSMSEKAVKLSAYMRMRLEDGTFIEEASDGRDEEKQSRAWPYAMLSGNIRNATDGRILADYGRDFYQVNNVDADLLSAQAYSPLDFVNKRIETFSMYSAVDFNDTLHSQEYCVVNPQYADEGGNTFIKCITVTAPYSGNGNSPIKVLYDRTAYAGESIDYFYQNVSKSNNMVKTCLPIAANISFAHDIAPDEDKGILVNDSYFRPKLTYGNPPKNEILYNKNFDDIQKCFIKDEYLLQIDFSKLGTGDYWGVDMPKENYISHSNEIGRTLELQANFNIRLHNVRYHVPITTGMSIVSIDTPPEHYHFYQTVNGYTVYIPKINIRWGCFAAGTRIAMADGSQKPAEKIKCGDIMYTMVGDFAVKNVYVGAEEILIHVCTESGRVLRVTHTHPVVLKGGYSVQARKVRPGQEVMLRDGGTDRVKWVYECEYHADVYNFELEDGKEHTIAAEGILTGEFVAQNHVKASLLSRQNITPETQALVEQFSAMLKNREKE